MITKANPKQRFVVLTLTLTLFVMALTGASAVADSPLPPGIDIYPFAEGMKFATAMQFGPDGSLYYIDTYAKHIGVLDPNGDLIDTISIPVEAGTTAGQILGLTLAPDFTLNPYFYVHYLQREPVLANIIVRFRYKDGTTSDVSTILDVPLPSDQTDHNGGPLLFGSGGGALYVSMGDHFSEPERAQNLTLAEGSILRIHYLTGEGLPDNPFYDGDGPNDDRIWAYGLRNNFGMTLDAATGNLWSTENGPACGDEVNRIVRGKSYGWPVSSSDYFECHDPGPPHIAPAWYWEQTIAPTGITAYTSTAIPAWGDSLLMCSWNNGLLHRLILNPARNVITAVETIDISPASCKLDIDIGPDGNIYVLEPTAIYRIVKSAPLWLPLIIL